MCIRDSFYTVRVNRLWPIDVSDLAAFIQLAARIIDLFLRRINRVRADATFLTNCLLYTSDAADERSSVDLGGRRIIKKQNKKNKNKRKKKETQHDAKEI